MIDGIGPKISELLSNGGIRTWTDLAATEVGRLKALLQAGGGRFALADPTHWPAQAGLAAAGRMDELKKLQATLRKG